MQKYQKFFCFFHLESVGRLLMPLLSPRTCCVSVNCLPVFLGRVNHLWLIDLSPVWHDCVCLTMTHCVLIYFSQDMQRAVENSAEIPLCVGQLTGGCDCGWDVVFDVCVALEMVGVLIGSAGQKYSRLIFAIFWHSAIADVAVTIVSDKYCQCYYMWDDLKTSRNSYVEKITSLKWVTFSLDLEFTLQLRL